MQLKQDFDSVVEFQEKRVWTVRDKALIHK